MLAGVAAAQGRPPALGEIPDNRSLEVPYFFPTQNGMDVVHEWAWPGQYLYVRNQLNWLLPKVKDLAPRLFYRTPELDVVAGSQLLFGATPFFDVMSIQGMRLAGRAGARWTWTLFGGRTENSDELLVSGSTEQHNLAGGSVGFRPNPYQSWGGSILRYASDVASGLNRSVASAQGFLSDRRTWSVLNF